ncbi:MAG: helicase HerA-like domain-containing protein [Planctomycetota bacterium]
MSEFFIGFDRMPKTPEGDVPAIERPALHLEADTLLRHMMALGSSGSGKTVLCKVVIEEMIRHGLPAICIDPQGDLCSLALHADDPEFLASKGVDPELAAEFRRKVDPVIFTPASRKGIALSADPMAIDVDSLQTRDRVYAISSIATMVVSLLGYDLDSDDGAGLVAVFDKALAQLQKRNDFPRDLEAFTKYLLHLDDASKEEFGRYLDVKKIDHACQKLARLDVGARRLLFHEGLALDTDLLLGLGEQAGALPGKTRLSIVYLNTLHSQEDKEFFVAALVERLYNWMLRNPSKEPQAMFYIDEVAPFIPPVRKPACKPALSLLFKQARKYGVCCLMATQNPADVDYKAMAQFGTWAIGRLTTRQDMKKVQPTVKSLDPVNVDSIMEELPAQKPGQFVLISPDNFEHTHRLQCRWLYTKHETLDDEKIEALMDEPLAAAISPEPPAPEVADTEEAIDEEEDEFGTVHARQADEFEDEFADETETLPDSDDESPEDHEEAVGETIEDEPLSVRDRFYELEDDIQINRIDAEPEPEVSDEDDEPLPAFESQGVAAKTATRILQIAKAAPPKPEQPEIDEDLEAADKLLTKAGSLSTKEFAAKAGIGSGAARGRLLRLIAAKRARKYKEGREHRYYSIASELRPDLGLDRKVRVIVSRVTSNDAERAAREVRNRSTLFGLIGDDETLDHAELDYRLVIQLSFTEKVTKMFLRRIFSRERHDVRLDSVYLHPGNLKIVVFQPEEGIRLENKPEEYASRIVDFDGSVTFEEILPGRLKLRESEIRNRKSDAIIKDSFKKRYSASPKKIEPVFLPVWNLHLKTRGRSGSRIVTVDGLAGKMLEW